MPQTTAQAVHTLDAVVSRQQQQAAAGGGAALSFPVPPLSTMAHHPHSAFARRLAGAIKRFRLLVIAFWVAVVALGLVFGLRFLDATVSDFPAPKGRCESRMMRGWACVEACSID